MEECHQQAKGLAGLGQHQVRLWTSFHRHTVLSMSALVVLAVAAACPQPTPPAPASPAPGTGQQPWGWAGTGILPASPDQPSPEDPGLVRVSVPEARRLPRLATTLMTAAARQRGYAWSAWRRKHQARARCHHYQARLRAPSPAWTMIRHFAGMGGEGAASSAAVPSPPSAAREAGDIRGSLRLAG